MTQIDRNADVAPRLLPPALFIGFATAVAMWAVGYVLHLPGIRASGIVTGPLLLLLMTVGAAAAGRAAPPRRGWLTGLVASLITGLLNLMVLGSLLTTDAGGAHPHAALWLTGWLAFSAGLGAVVGLVSRRAAMGPDLTATTRTWLARFAALTVGAVFCLLIVGGLVTSTETGMAVPDWPGTYGANMFLFPLSQMTGGIYLEHAHRLFGALVGLTTLACAAFTFVVDRRRPVLVLAAVAFILVCIQGLLGGMRVEMNEQAGALLRMAHGLSAHIFIGLVALLAATLSRTWRIAPGPQEVPGAGKTRLLSLLFLVFLLIQIGLGVAARHTDSNLHAVITHSTFSVLALIFAIAAGAQAKAAHPDIPILRRTGTGAMHASGLQMLLGAAALWAVLAHRDSDPVVEVALATAHQVLGAVLVILAVLLTAWSRRLLAPPPQREQTPAPAAA